MKYFESLVALAIVASSTATLSGCGASELNRSLLDVTGQNISVIRSYPNGYTKAINNNKVYVFSRARQGIGCDIFFEVNDQNTIVKASYKGEACNSFYQDTLKPE